MQGFSCVMGQRIRKVERYIAGQPGQIGILLHDRKTGVTWGNANADTDFPAASTVKLAMITDLLLRRRDGAISLGSYDFELIDSVLTASSDTAADQLWFSFEDAGFLQRIQRFGMRTASFTSSAYWGFMYCSARDLDGLMNYVLSDIPPGDRDFITRRLRHVSAIQQWGVWGAGQNNHPGNKDGWEDDGGVWIVDTVGFAGPHARYTLAIMDD
ncbi:MAG TPA: tat pathway signal sequence, partial [Streptosporangiaceae bacterium]